MRPLFLPCIVVGLSLSACAGTGAPVAPLTSTPAPPATPTFAPTQTPALAPTTTSTPLPLTHLDLWLSAEDDPAATPVRSFKAGSVAELYIWARAPQGVEGDFTLSATYQTGINDRLGPTFHAKADGQPIDCGFWSGGFLTQRGNVSLSAYSGDQLLGSYTFSID